MNDADNLDSIISRSIANYIIADRPYSKMRHEIITSRSHRWIFGQVPTRIFESLDLAQCSAEFVQRNKLQNLVKVAS